eukprot:Lithocolla_globosa_v1_NODE_2354_length_2037_cov_4.667003.p3 type:complete len:100 gc:universal NODE_2354_length_2037_cov_4.667003:1035-736(-)
MGASAMNGLLSQRPRKAKNINAPSVVFKRIWINAVDDWHDHPARVISHSGHQRLQPPIVDFDMTIEECNRFTSRSLGTSHPGSHQTRTLCLTEQFDFWR